WVVIEYVIQPTELAGLGLTTMPLTPRAFLYALSAASAEFGSSVMFAAASNSSFCQAVRNAVPVWVAEEAPVSAAGENPTVGTAGVVPGILIFPAAVSPAAAAT